NIPAGLSQTTGPLIGECIVGLRKGYQVNEWAKDRRSWLHHPIGRYRRATIHMGEVGFPIRIVQDEVCGKKWPVNVGGITKPGRHQQVRHSWWRRLNCFQLRSGDGDIEVDQLHSSTHVQMHHGRRGRGSWLRLRWCRRLWGWRRGKRGSCWCGG